MNSTQRFTDKNYYNLKINYQHIANNKKLIFAYFGIKNYTERDYIQTHCVVIRIELSYCYFIIVLHHIIERPIQIHLPKGDVGFGIVTRDFYWLGHASLSRIIVLVLY